MTIVAWFVSAVLVMEQSSPSDAKCPPADNACKAALFVKQAKDAKTPLHRAQLLYAAHRRYLALFDETGERKHLCAARRNFDQSLAVEEQPDAQRAAYEAGRRDLVSREKKAGVRCGSNATRPPKPKPPVPIAARPDAAPPTGTSVAARPDAAPPTGAPESSPTSVADGSASVGGPGLPPAAEPTPGPTLAELAPVTGTIGRDVHAGRRPPTMPQAQAVSPAGPAVEAPAPVPAKPTDSTRRSRSGRDLLIAGGVMFVPGIALTAAVGSMGHGLVETKRDAEALHSMYPGPPTEEQRAHDLALAREYQENFPPTVALAVAAGASFAIAGVLLGLGKRRARAASNTALIPLPGGVTVGMKF